MRKSCTAALVTTALVTAAAFAAPAHADHHEATVDGHSENGDPVRGLGAMLKADLTGGVEVPGPGDSDGSGQFIAWQDENGQFCYRLRVAQIAPATMAHIHAGAAGVAGGVAMALEPPADGTSESCTTLDGQLAGEIWNNPQGYYVNVHNAEFPAGAVRGQLLTHTM